MSVLVVQNTHKLHQLKKVWLHLRVSMLTNVKTSST